jgi:hypothetical protein
MSARQSEMRETRDGWWMQVQCSNVSILFWFDAHGYRWILLETVSHTLCND